MPNWADILKEITEEKAAYDRVRRKYLNRLHEKTGRNVIIYYSGWLQKPEIRENQISDNDKNGLMTAIHGLDRTSGLDLILHTPGGETAATESIVDYLHGMFSDIRAVVPQIAMSGGTMVACACNRIVMGKQSSLGPIDPMLRSPLFGSLPAHGVLEEFNHAHRAIKFDPTMAAVWQPIIAKYPPTLIGECQKAIQWANDMVKKWLQDRMFNGEEANDTIEKIVLELGTHAVTLSHDRHLSASACRSLGLKVDMLEEDDDLQDAVLSVHHATMQTLSETNAYKIIENHKGAAYISSAKQVLVTR